MVLDGHMHIKAGPVRRDTFLADLDATGVGGGVLISYPPATFFPAGATTPTSPKTRLDNLMAWCAPPGGTLYPFYWIDPIEEDAVDQVAMAVTCGVAGFKVICDRYYPGDQRAMPVYLAIAQARRPILFHSGILWDGKPSAPYNRPAEFEALLEIPNLKFALAHISWPWCDELIAVLGKFLNASAGGRQDAPELFVDLTPGTPPIYRRPALTHLFSVGYDVESNVIFGSDCYAGQYNGAWTRQWIERDNAIYAELGLAQKTLDAIYAENLLRFVGARTDHRERTPPRQAE